MNDFDLEELESRLYSQVYHGFNEESEQIPQVNSGTNNLSKPTNEMRRSGARYFGPWSPGVKFQKQNAKSPRRDANKSESLYGKNSGKPRRQEVAINQVVVVSSKRTLKGSNSKERSKAKWKDKVRERINQKRELKRQNINKGGPQMRLKQTLEDSVITLSDSEDDACVLVDNNWPLLCVADSDDDKTKCSETDKSLILKTESKGPLNESLTEDVIFVEPVVAPLEIINIDEEHENHDKSNVETASSTGSDASSNNTLKKQSRDLQKERKELLSTPDSASNDFINNSGVEFNQHNFNFSLHGSDFNNGDFVKPAPRNNETCETESSSSTTDANSVNLMKTPVFNEVDFPKDDIFAENNLETFGNFITPLRSTTRVTGVQSSPVHTPDIHNNVYSTDSSSESDLDESNIDKTKDIQKMKLLPELSPMLSNKDQIIKDVGTSQSQKKPRKLSNMCSKYDLLDSKYSDSPAKDAKKLKKKKKKKKKSENNEESSSNASRESSIPPTENEGDDEVKRKKKRKSSFVESNENSKKKAVSETNDDSSAVKSVGASAVLTDSNTSEMKEEIQENRHASTSKLSNSSGTSALATDKMEVKESTKTSEDNKQKIKDCPEDNVTVTDAGKPNSNQNLKVKNESSEIIVETPLESVVVDETDYQETSMILSSESESVLSPLHEPSEITLNCENVSKDLSSTSESAFGFEFSVEELQQKMSDDPYLWEILDVDKYPIGRSRGRRCNRCKMFGHGAIRCYTKVEPKCSLCGGKGHYEPRCPNKICMQCGHRSSYSTNYCSSCFKYRAYQCHICSMKGHLSGACPDLWRRYYLTTTGGPIVTYNGPLLKDKNQLWCSGCAQSGHLEHNCRFHKSIYPPADPFIKSFKDIYDEPARVETEQTLYFEPPEPIPPPPLLQEFEIHQRHPGQNYNENAYGPMNPQFINPYVDGIFVAGQQNFFHPMAPNVVPYPQNTYLQNQNQFTFDSVLPNFISLETEVRPPENFIEVPTFVGQKSVAKLMKRNNSMFFNSSALQLQHFVNEELNRLSKLSFLTNKVVKELKKKQPPRKCDLGERAEYFEKLNMVLFGVFNLNDGKMHLERLKRFKRDKLKSRLGHTARRMLHKSYCYIFGNDKHNGVHYHELLRRI